MHWVVRKVADLADLRAAVKVWRSVGTRAALMDVRLVDVTVVSTDAKLAARTAVSMVERLAVMWVDLKREIKIREIRKESKKRTRWLPRRP